MPGTVTFTLTGTAPGRNVKGRCVKPTKRNLKRRKCTRPVTLRGSIVQTGSAGKNSFVFTGRIGGKKLGPGTYQLSATPSANGQTGAPQTVTFKIVR
jgi:hypothetical protein